MCYIEQVKKHQKLGHILFENAMRPTLRIAWSRGQRELCGEHDEVGVVDTTAST